MSDCLRLKRRALSEGCELNTSEKRLSSVSQKIPCLRYFFVY
ncbi:hypothetical protein EVA_05567 [gut metagenome]|uniref:Uncharacterized protein n=1 Tax=gut metagenome TaxID=749906 RepID=J9GG28_9ZZZZ